ncbi:MAG TPA: hypothetical protein ENK52_03565 [Saprospiraceae bacterium]|nr:hypothetical protein [Saprospiraceae bacterium]
MKRLLMLFLGMVCLGQSIFAQNNCDRMYIGGSYTFLQALSDLKTGGFYQGQGVSFDLFYALNPYDANWAIHAGLRLDGVAGKSIKTNITLADPENAVAESKIYNSIFGAKLLLRGIYRKYERFSPYVEGFGGFRATAGHERLDLKKNYPGVEKLTTKQLVDQANWVVGGSVGVLLKLSPRIDFDLRASLDYSPELSYINMDTYQINEDDISYQFSKTPGLDYSLHVGFRIKMDCVRHTGVRRHPNPRARKNNRKRRAPTKKSPKTTTKS